MSYITDVFVGQTRIIVTGYNPATPATMLKVAFVVGKIKDAFGDIDEEQFTAWLRTAPDGERVLAAYRAGKLDRPDPRAGGVDPRNAREELAIIEWLKGERHDGRRPGYVDAGLAGVERGENRELRGEKKEETT